MKLQQKQIMQKWQYDSRYRAWTSGWEMHFSGRDLCVLFTSWVFCTTNILFFLIGASEQLHLYYELELYLSSDSSSVFLNRVSGFAHNETIGQAFVKMSVELRSSLTTSPGAQMLHLSAWGNMWVQLPLPILSSSPYVSTVLMGPFHCAGKPHTLR